MLGTYNPISTSFGEHLRKYFTEAKFDPNDGLRYSQFVPIEYMRLLRAEKANAPESEKEFYPRGLIINHKMGLGKTILAVALAADLRREGYSVIVIGPRTLSQNFEDNVQKFANMGASGASSGEVSTPLNYDFFTLRASNLPQQIIKTYLFGNAGRGVNKAKRKEQEDVIVEGNVTLAKMLEKKVVIIDEAHLFCNSVAHGRETALEMYRGMMTAKDIFVFLLTGTLIVNSPFEAVPAYNLVSGRNIFPEDEKIFYDFFGTPEKIEERKCHLQNLVSGLLSYRSVNAADAAGNEAIEFPEKLPIKVVKLTMTDEQMTKYIEARETESAENKQAAKRRGNNDMFIRSFGRDESSSSYKVRSRIISNGPNKWQYIADRVMACPRELCLVQTMFVERGGIKECAKYLADHCEYHEFVIDGTGHVHKGPPDLVGKQFKAYEDGLSREELAAMTWQTAPECPVYVDEQGKPLRYYFVLSGETDDEVLAWAMKVLCDARNRYGAFIHVLFCSSVGSLGLDLKNGRHVFYVSMHFHLEEFNQTIARYVRMGASRLLKPEERNVQPYILLSMPKGNRPSNGSGEEVQLSDAALGSTDAELFSLAMIKLKTNETFMNTIRGVSVECLAGVSTSPELCRSCQSTGRPLTTGNFAFDMKLPNPCMTAPRATPAFETLPRLQLSVGEHSYDVVYSTNPLRVYEWTGGNVYRKVPSSHPLHEAVVQVLDKK